MAQLTPEERRRIYEEEKVRMEARQKLAIANRASRFLNGCALFVIVAVGLVVWVNLSSINHAASSYSSGSDLSSERNASSPPPPTYQGAPSGHFVKPPKSGDESLVKTTGTDWRIGDKHDYIKLTVSNGSDRTVVSTKVKIEFLDTLGSDAIVVKSMIKRFNDRVPAWGSKEYEIPLSSPPHATRCRSDVEEVHFDPSQIDLSHLSQADKAQIVHEVEAAKDQAYKESQRKYGDAEATRQIQFTMLNRLEEKYNAQICKKHKISREQLGEIAERKPGVDAPADIASQTQTDTDQLSFAHDKDRIRVLDNWEWTGKGDYDYIKGSVQNNSSLSVSFWKVTVHFLNRKKETVDTTYTNSGEILPPGASKRFEVMHPRNSEAFTAKVFVEEVQFSN